MKNALSLMLISLNCLASCHANGGTTKEEKSLASSRWENSSGDIRFYKEGLCRYNSGCSSVLGRWNINQDGRVTLTYPTIRDSKTERLQEHSTLMLTISTDGKFISDKGRVEPWERKAPLNKGEALHLAEGYLKVRFPKRAIASYTADINLDKKTGIWWITYSSGQKGREPSRGFRVSIDSDTSDLTFYETI